MRNKSCWIVPGIVLLSILAGEAGECWRWLAPQPSSPEDVYFRLRVGMPFPETIAVLEDSYIDTISIKGTTRDGREIYRYDPIPAMFFKNLPPPEDIDHCVIAYFDDEGQDVVVTLGPGGAVVDKQIIPGVIQGRWEKAQDRAYCAINFDLQDWSWWKRQARKLLRACHNWFWHLGAVVAAVLLPVSWWAVQGWVRSRGRGQRQCVTSGSAALPGFFATTGRSSSNS
jgi:hypothetical protein